MTISQRITRYLPSGVLARNVTVLAGGTVLAQAINLLVSPILTRLYTPDDFGTLAVYTSVLTVLSIIASWRFEQAIPLPEDDQSAGAVVRLSGVILVGMTGLTALGLGAGSNRIAAWFQLERLTQYLWLFPVSLIGLGTYQIATYWATRKQAYPVIARTKVWQQIWGQGVISVSLGLARTGPIGLLLGYVVGQVIGVGSLCRLMLKERAVARWGSWTELGTIAVRYRKFPLVSTWANLVNVLGLQFPVIYLTHTFSTAVVGHYSMANRVLGLPSALVGQAIAQVFYPYAAQMREVGQLKRMAERLVVSLFALGLPVFAVIMAVGPQLFSAVFGRSWVTAGYYSQILSPWYIVLLVSSPLSTISLVKERQGLAFFLTLYELALRLGLMWVGGSVLKSDMWSMGLLSVAGIAISLVSITVMLKLAGGHVNKVVLPCLICLAKATPVVLALWVVAHVVGGITVIALSGVAGLVLLFLMRKPIMELAAL